VTFHFRRVSELTLLWQSPLEEEPIQNNNEQATCSLLSRFLKSFGCGMLPFQIKSPQTWSHSNLPLSVTTALPPSDVLVLNEQDWNEN
jgi:hypothetical protein